MNRNSVKNLILFVSNFLLIGFLFCQKLFDIFTSLHFIGYKGIYEANIFVVPLLENPILLLSLFFLFIGFISGINLLFYYKKGFNEFLYIYLFFLVLLNLQGIWVLINNYEIFKRVNLYAF